MTAPVSILIIDDSPDDRENYRRALRKAPEVIYECADATEGNAGLQRIEQSLPDCVLLDYSLPGMNGFQVLQSIRERYPFLPVILLTGQGSETVAAEAIKQGAQNYLNKSLVNAERLHNAISLAIKQSTIQAKLAGTTRQLRESDALKSAILENTKHMVVATDTGGTVTIFNRAAEIASGYAAPDIIGKKTPVIWHDAQEIAKRAEQLTAELGAIVAPGVETFTRKATLHGVDENEWTFVCENGARFPVNITVTPIRDVDGAIIGYLHVLEDITRRKEMERMKNEFISIVSHELRTPLTSIRGSLGLIVGALSEGLPEKTGHLLDIAHKNSERLILLVNDMLDIDKMTAGEMRFDIKPESLQTLMQQCVEATRAYAEKFHVTIDPEPAPDIAVEVDATRFIQIFSNLLSNAAKFSPEGSTVRVFTALQGEKIRINVQDNGPGIPESFRTHIFEKFAQVDSSATRAKGGSGLGLHIAKLMVERMNGEITFDTSPGQGTVFRVDFPQIKERVA